MLQALSRASRVGSRSLKPAQLQQLRFLNIHEYQVRWVLVMRI